MGKLSFLRGGCQNWKEAKGGDPEGVKAIGAKGGNHDGGDQAYSLNLKEVPIRWCDGGQFFRRERLVGGN